MTQEQEKLLAISKGFDLIPDHDRGHGWCKFQKGNYHIWQTRNLKWQTAYQIDNYFRGHGLYDTLEEAFNRPHIISFDKLGTGESTRYVSKEIGPYVFEISFHVGLNRWVAEGTDVHKGLQVLFEKNTSMLLAKADVLRFCKEKFEISFTGEIIESTEKAPQKIECMCGKDKHNFHAHTAWCPKFKE